MSRFGHESFRPWVVSAGSFRPGLFRPDLRVGRFGLIWWVVSAQYPPPPPPIFYITRDTVFFFMKCTQGGVGGYSHFFFIRMLGPSIYRSLPPPKKKIYGISSNPKKYLKFWQPQKYSRFCTLILRKYPKMHRNYH